MTDALKQLVANPAFWTFLGTCVIAYYGYKGIVRRYPLIKRQTTQATSFEELRAVVEVLQGELVKKDKRHKDDTDYLMGQMTELRSDNRELTLKLAQALRDSADCKLKTEQLTASLRHHENRLNKAHIPRNGTVDDPDNAE